MLEFVPRSQLRDRLLAGWTLVNGHDYSPADYAILMWPPVSEDRAALHEAAA